MAATSVALVPASAAFAYDGSDSASATPMECTVFDDDSLDVSLGGLPFTVVAGDWAQFTVLVHNRGDHTINSAEPSVSVDLYGKQQRSDFDLQYQDPQSGQWQEVPEWSKLGTPFTSVEVAPGATITVEMRIHAAAKAPDGGGFIMDYGTWDNRDGTCGNSDGDQGDFTVKGAAASATASPSPTASPTASASASASPSGSAGPEPSSSSSAGTSGTGTQTSSRGALAETGSPSALPAVALIGGAAVAVGAGALVVRRRRNARP